MGYKVKEAAELAGVSVRTLHYYDRIGLLKPESVSPAGYRLYTDRDLERLQQVLFFKELGFSLQETGEIMDDPSFDRKQALVRHRELLLEKRDRLDRIITSVEETMNALNGGVSMEKERMFSAFDMSGIEAHKAKYAEETKQKYGGMVEYKASMKKTSGYTKDDWARITAEADGIYRKLADNMDKGPDAPVVQEAVAAWRQHITTNYYNCTPDIFRGLGDMYTEDERFTANIDKYKTGLAAFLRDAMNLYCDRQK